MKTRLYISLLCISALPWAGWVAGTPVGGTDGSSGIQAALPTAQDDLSSFAANGARILESQKGDLEGNGRQGALLVIDPPTTADEKLGEGPSRDVVLLIRDASGQLHKVASNARIVPCATCGGVAGDPFGYSRIEAGRFTVVNGGGSRERWSDEYTFAYVADKKNWFISRVVRRVEDRETGKHKQIDLTARELGPVSFQDFDPSHLPEVDLP